MAAAIVAGFAEHDFSMSKAAGPGVVAVVATVGALPSHGVAINRWAESVPWPLLRMARRGERDGWRPVCPQEHKPRRTSGWYCAATGIGVCVATQPRQINLRRAHYKYASLCHYDLAVDVDMLLVGKPHKSDIACCPLLDRVAWTLVVTCIDWLIIKK